MQKIAWVLNITGWVLTIRTLWLLIAGSAGVSAIVTGIVYLFSHLPTWLLVILFICLTIALFVGFGYLSDAIKKRTQSKLAVGGFIGRANGGKVSRCSSTGKTTVHGKPEEGDVGGFIGQSKNVEIVDSSTDVEIEYKQDKE